MRTFGIVTTTLALLTAALLPSIPAEGLDAYNPAEMARFDLSAATAKDFNFLVPADEPVRVVYDHVTGEMWTESVGDVDTTQQGATGCIFLKPGFGWKTDPIGLLTCPHQMHNTGIAQSIMLCVVAGSCFEDGINFDFAAFGFYFISCSRPALIVHDWVAGTLVNIGCTVFVFGANPNTWTMWDSICAGSGAGVMVCSNTLR